MIYVSLNIILFFIIFYSFFDFFPKDYYILKLSFVLRNKIIVHFFIDPNQLFNKHGPGALLRGLIEASKTFKGKCDFKKWSLNYTEIEHNTDQNHFFYIFNGIGFCENMPSISSKHPDKVFNTLFGPIMAPLKWNQFPQANNCFEKNFSKSLQMMGAYIVHSKRVRDHLILKSGAFHANNKFGIMRACSNFFPTSIKPFGERKWDIIFYEKYADVNKFIDAQHLIKLLVNANMSIKRISYYGGIKNSIGYNSSIIKQIANNSKFVIYFSFWDTGAISLKEIQNYGVYSFTVQKDLINNETGFFVPQLNGKIVEASEIIIQQIKSISKKFDSEKASIINQYQNSCHRSLEELCHKISEIRSSIYKKFKN